MNTKRFLPLELDQELLNEKVVTKYAYDLEASSFVIEFSEEYDGKTIALTIDIEDWEASIERLQKHLTSGGINDNHIQMICDTADNNAIKISDYVKDRLKDEKEEKISFKNCMLRIPGSINSKNGQQVRILQKWDGKRPYINWILKDFQRYLIQKKIGETKQREEQQIHRYFSTDWAK